MMLVSLILQYFGNRWGEYLSKKNIKLSVREFGNFYTVCCGVYRVFLIIGFQSHFLTMRKSLVKPKPLLPLLPRFYMNLHPMILKSAVTFPIV